MFILFNGPDIDQNATVSRGNSLEQFLWLIVNEGPE